MISPHELRAPSEDGGILCHPAPPLLAELISENRKRLSNATPLILGKSLQDIRTLARRETISTAVEFLKSNDEEVKVDPALPLMVSGHQPELFHPGVWIKNFALNFLSKKHTLTPLNLIIDNDMVKQTSISFPVISDVPESSKVIACDFDQNNFGMPHEDWMVKNHEIFDGFGQRLAALSSAWKETPMGIEYWRDVSMAVAKGIKPALAFAWARRKYERMLGCVNLELPVSLLCGTQSFSIFVLDIIRRAEAFANLFNQSVASYRNKHGLKSKNHPFPDLGVAKGWAEIPFWLLLPGENRRQRLGVKEVSGEIILGTPGPQGLRLSLGVDDQLGALRKLESQGYRIRPRAISTTIFARLLISDAFIHGIGGAKYDEVTDRMIQDFYQVTPPEFLVVSATARLNLAGDLETESSVQAANHIARDIWWNPQRHPPCKPTDEWNALVYERQKLQDLSCDTRAGRKERYKKLRNNLDQLRVLIKANHDRELERARKLSDRFNVQQQLQSRDFSFLLHSGKKLRNLFKPYL